MDTCSCGVWLWLCGWTGNDETVCGEGNLTAIAIVVRNSRDRAIDYHAGSAAESGGPKADVASGFRWIGL